MPYRIVELDADLDDTAIVLDGAVQQQCHAQLGDLAITVRSTQRRGGVTRHDLDAIA